MNWIFSPLEQFDSVTFIGGSRFFESINLYSFYIFETEYNLIARLQNGETSFLGLPLFWTNSTLFLMISILSIIFFIRFFSAEKSKVVLIQDFNHLFFGIVFSLFLPSIFDFVFLTTSVMEEISNQNMFFSANASFDDVKNNLDLLSNTIVTNWTSLPQMYFSFAFDENFISFLLAFFLLGGAEEEEDEDFILEEEESDFIDDIVAPLFYANLGKDVEGNGELLVKVSSVFGFVLINNLMGMLPYSDTGTSSLMLTFWVALSIFVSLHTIMFRKQGLAFFFRLFMPAGCPLPLLFLVIPLEFISYSFRLVSLSVRLFANMMAGHTLLKVIVGFSFSMILMGDSMLLVNLFPIAVLFILTFLEVGVALIQAYIFTILTCIYLKDVFVSH